MSYNLIMEVFPHQIEYYRTGDGKAPFKEWLESLADVETRAKIRAKGSQRQDIEQAIHNLQDHDRR